MKKIISIVMVFVAIASILPAYAEEIRMMSLRNNETYLRYGPSTDYPVKWVYYKRKLPVKVVARFEQWRKIQDPFGEEGWVHSALLSSHETALVITDKDYLVVRKKGKDDAEGAFRIEPGVIVDIEGCENTFCAVSIAGYNGFLEKKYLWGIE